MSGGLCPCCGVASNGGRILARKKQGGRGDRAVVGRAGGGSGDSLERRRGRCCKRWRQEEVGARETHSRIACRRRARASYAGVASVKQSSCRRRARASYAGVASVKQSSSTPLLIPHAIKGEEQEEEGRWEEGEAGER